MNESDIKVGVPGLILEGNHLGWYTLVENNAGYYLILIFNNASRIEATECFECKAEDMQAVAAIFKKSKWKVKWLVPISLNKRAIKKIQQDQVKLTFDTLKKLLP